MFIGRTDAEPEVPIPWPPDVKSKLFERTLMLGKIEGKREGPQRMKWLDVMTDSVDMNLSRFGEMVRDREAWRSAVCGVAKSQARLND